MIKETLSLQAGQMLPEWVTGSKFESQLELVELDGGELLFEQGEESDALYLVLAGAVTVYTRTEDQTIVEIDKLFSGDVVGEIGVLSGQERTATVKAMVPCRLLKVTAEQFADIRVAQPEIATGLLKNNYERWQRIQLATILAKLFGDVDAQLVHELQRKLIWKNLAAGDVLCRQNDAADSMFLIVSGRLRIDVKNDAGEVNNVGDAGSGETIGEYALLTAQTRSATVVATRESVVAEITKEEFDELSHSYPQIIPAVTRIIVERQQRAIGHVSAADQTNKMIVTIMTADSDLDLAPFLGQLQETMSAYGSTLFLSAKQIDTSLGVQDIAQSTINSLFGPLVSQWLTKQESESDYMVLIADPTWSEWTERCIRMSDRLLTVGRPECKSDGRLDAIEKHVEALNLPIRQDLVLWHPAETEMPEGTSAWLKRRPAIAQHHHIRDQDKAHFGRLARSILGKSIGVVFSGGGARGYVQLGVLQAMDELGLPVDYIGGTSFGGIMASFPPREKTIEWVAPYIKQFSNPKFTQDRTIPLVALNKSAGLVTLLTSLCGDVRIEDLWLPYFTTASNISTAESVVIESGPLWLALRKTIAIPGIYTPVVEDGHVFVDGGIMNNFPLDVMADKLGHNRIIGVSISPLEGKKRDYDLGHSASGWKLLWNRINPFSKTKRVPSLGYTLLRTMEVNSLQLSRKNLDLVDLFLAINPKKFGFLDFAKSKDIIQYGYEASFEALKKWKSNQPEFSDAQTGEK